MTLTRYLLRPFIASVSLLLLPLVAMQFTHEVQWTALDFVLMGLLLLLGGMSLEWIFVHATGRKRWLWASAALILLLLVWVELAVGLLP